MAFKFLFNPFTGNFDYVDSLGSVVAAMTDNSIPYVSGGTLVEDNANFFINHADADDSQITVGQASLGGMASLPNFTIAHFSHRSNATLADFAFGQLGVGSTFINSKSGFPITFGDPFLPVFTMDKATLIGTFKIGSACRWEGATSGYTGFVAPAVAPSVTYTLFSAGAAADDVVKANASNALSTGKVVNANIDSSAAIALSKLATLTAYRVVQTNSSGVLSAPVDFSTGLIPFGTSDGDLTGSSGAVKYLTNAGVGINKANPVDAGIDVHGITTSMPVIRGTAASSQSADLVRLDFFGGTQLFGIDRLGLIKGARGTVGNATGTLFAVSDQRDGLNIAGGNVVQLFTNAATRFSITNSGTTLNSGVLDLTAGTAAAPALTRTGDLNTGAHFAGGADTFSISTGGTDSVVYTTTTATVSKGLTQTIAGTSASNAKVGGILVVNTTAVGNVGAGADDLITYSLPANSLSTNNYFVRIEAFGTFAANANSKQLEMLFGATVVYDTGAQIQNGGSWRIQATVIRTAAATQKAIGQFVGSTALFGDDATYSAPAETLSGAVTIKCRGTGTNNDDIKQEGLIVEWFPA